MSRGLHFNFQIGGLGMPKTAGRSAAIRQQLEQLLFTIKGERVNRPTFGSGVQHLVFSGASPEIASAAEYVVASGIRDHMGDVIIVDGVRVTADQALLTIDIAYTLRASGEAFAESFTRPLEGPP